MRALPWAMGAVIVAGCAGVQKERGHQEVAALVEERIGRKTRWDQGTPEDAQVREHLRGQLEKGLTVDRAVEIALLNNPSLRRTYEELGVSQAEMVQAGLLANPVLDAHVGFPVGGEGIAELVGGLTQNFLSIFMLPLRKQVAQQQFQADILRVADEALAAASEVEKDIRELQAAQKRVELRKVVVFAEATAAEFAERLHAAGNVTALAVAEERATYEESRLQLGREELALAEAREKLNRRLGLWGQRTQWTLAESLPELPAEEPSLEHLEKLAIRQRLDIEAARLERELLWKALELARTWRWFGSIEIGVDYHRDADGPRVAGPTLVLELPIFDQRQALIARLESQFRQAEQRLDELSINTRSAVRLQRLRLEVSRQLVEHYLKDVLPLRERVDQQAQLQYNAMQIGFFELLAAKQKQLAARTEYVQALQDYWQARAELDRLVGGRLPASATPTPSTTPPPTPREEDHDGHTH